MKLADVRQFAYVSERERSVVAIAVVIAYILLLTYTDRQLIHIALKSLASLQSRPYDAAGMERCL